MTEQPPAQAGSAAPKQPRRTSKTWVIVALAFGILGGLLLALSIRLQAPQFGPASFFLLSVERALELHVVLTTIEMVLLFSLVIAYLKVYSETRANFSLGLLIVLFGLLIHSIFSYPLTVNQIGPVLLGSGAFFPYTDLFTIFAYTVFLYLSLE
ncbi:MAG: hypothetical protein LYZ70_00960 [Nitrososphaerales archaeon]|nr:hypothetical protein [Nitrososphaerales archaeon]